MASSQLITAALAASGAVYGLIYVLANRLVYLPTRYPDGFWERQGEFGAQDVWLVSGDRVKLHGWWVEVPGARTVTLYLHGNAGNVSYRVGHLREIPAAGSAFLIIDYRGYGKSEGRPSEQGFYRDADAGYDWLTARGYRPEQIVVHGESLGTGVAVDLAARRPCGGLVLESPFTSVTEMAGRTVPYLGSWFVWGFDSLRKIRNVHAPLLIIHGDQDGIVPIEMGRRLFAAANEPKRFWTVAGAGHVDIVDTAGPQFAERMREYYESLWQARPGE